MLLKKCRMENIEYRPRFKSYHINIPTIIGGVIDYSPIMDKIASPNIKFTDNFNNNFDKQIVISNLNNLSTDLLIEISIYYRGEVLNVRSIINRYDLIDISEPIILLNDHLERMLYSLKEAMYNLSPFKDELDRIYRELYMNRTLISNDYLVNREFELKKRIDNLEDIMNKEFERMIMSETYFESSQSIDKPQISKEEETFEEIESRLLSSSDTFKLTIKTIKRLDKERTDKFVLPLERGKDGDVDKFEHLTKQPFSFLNYNGATFCVNLNTGIHSDWDEDKDESVWISSVKRYYDLYSENTKKINTKKTEIYERISKVSDSFKVLSEQIDYLKKQFEDRSKKFKNSTYVKFLGERTIKNIETIRTAESIAKRKLEVLKNKNLIKRPIAFFERAATLYLGKTGEDIMTDMYKLGYTSKDIHILAIEYLFFLLKVVKLNEEGGHYTSPILPILNGEDTNSLSYIEPDLLRLMANHMFIHTINITTDYKFDDPVKKEEDPIEIPSIVYVME